MKIEHVTDYKVLRQQAYPDIYEQLDILGKHGVEALRKARAEVKARFPKPVKEPE